MDELGVDWGWFRAVYTEGIRKKKVCEEGFVRSEGVEGVDCSPEGKLAGFRIKLDILTATSGRTEWRCPRVAERMRELDTESPVVWPAWCYTGESIVEHFFLATKEFFLGRDSMVMCIFWERL